MDDMVKLYEVLCRIDGQRPVWDLSYGYFYHHPETTTSRMLVPAQTETEAENTCADQVEQQIIEAKSKGLRYATAAIYSVTEFTVPGYKIKLEKIVEEATK